MPQPRSRPPGPTRAARPRDLDQPRRAFPSKLFVEVTTHCNLRCSMCVKQAPGHQVVEGMMSREVFERLTPVFGGLEALVLNGIGEPTLHPSLPRFVARARELMPRDGWIGFQTNGQLLSEARAERLVTAGIDRISFSADATTDTQLMAIRDGATIGPIERAAAAVSGAAGRAGRHVSLGLEFVVMRDNLDQLPGLIGWAARHGIEFVVVTHLLPYESALVGQTMFSPTTDRALAIYRHWRDAARSDGVDVRRYLELPFVHRQFESLSRTLPLATGPDQAGARAAHYVVRMLQDAATQGVSLRLPDLLSFEDAQLDRVNAVFEAAAEAAATSGIALHLPATVPTQVRHCDFVEDGSAFVSWNGDLHPCYFLWHGFQCHLGGLTKTVRPVSFGNVASVSILTAWKSPDWVDFRQNVLRYDFPFCYDCNLALCDYVEGGEFEQDCHLTQVPCATCLWCTGPFQCLR